MDIEIDHTKPLNELIEKHILNEYEYLRKKVNTATGGYAIDHAVLTGIALGDRKTTTAFKRAHVSFEEGMKSVENLCDKGVIETESSQHYLTNKRGDSKVAKKLLFTTPFLRFWFAFISPIYKGIKEQNYKEFYTKYENKAFEFTDFIFEELCLEFLQDYFTDDPIDKIGKYWDNQLQIDIVAKTKKGKLIAASCRNVNTKLKKNELNKLTANCKAISLNIDTYVLFAKVGYTSEIKNMKGENLKLFTAKSLKGLLKD